MRHLLFTAFVLFPSLVLAAPGEMQSVRPSSPGSALHVMANQMIDLKAQSLGLYAPLPPTEAVTRDAVVEKLAALADAYTYSTQILDGLTANGATSSAQQQLADQLAPARERFERFVGEALIQLLTSPVVAADGWVVPATFGEAAETHAIALLPTLRDERPFLAALLTRIELLVSSGMASAETQNSIANLLDQSSIAHSQVGLSPE